MNNIQLFYYQHERKDKIKLTQILEIIDYFYEWIFRTETYEKSKDGYRNESY